MGNSVAVVVLDSLRKDSFDEQFEWLPGTRFENAWTTSHWTTPVHGSLFTGKYASEIGVHARSRLFDCQEPAIAEEFRRSDYTTRAFSANVHVSKQFGWDRGFDEFDTSWRVPPHPSGDNVVNVQKILSSSNKTGLSKYLHVLAESMRSDRSTYKSLRHAIELQLHYLNQGSHDDDGATQALEFVRNCSFDGDEFLFINLMEAHTPYTAPEPYRSVEPPEINALAATLSEPRANPDRLRAAYEDCVRYLSDQYQEIFSVLNESFDYIITLADHGEAFGEYGAWAHLCGLYPEVVHIPLTISGRDMDDTTVDEPVSVFDVYQTVREAGGLSAKNRGSSLLTDTTTSEHSPLITEYHGLLTQYEQSLKQKSLDPTPLLEPREGIRVGSYYGFADSWGVWQERGEPPGDPRALLEEYIANLDRETEFSAEEIPSSVEAQLRDLGYA